ncbi:MAG: hypothetical protein LJE62_09075 [Silicimonas sp.]|nr:hypothetical protein [Silicimonas sp.]
MYDANPKFLNKDGSINMTAALRAGRHIRSETAHGMFRGQRSTTPDRPRAGLVSLIAVGLAGMVGGRV